MGLQPNQPQLTPVNPALPLEQQLPVFCRYSAGGQPLRTDPITTGQELRAFQADLRVNPQWIVIGWYLHR